jgi:hypothetical protein
MSTDLPRLYAPLYHCPPVEDSPVLYSYAHMKEAASWVYYMKVKLDVNEAIMLASKCPYPDGVKTAVLKQVAFAKEITLQQMRVLLGWAAQKAQGIQVSGLRNDIGV